MLIICFDKWLFSLFISLKKFQAKTINLSGFFFIFSLEIIGIFTPGITFPCLSLLSSIIQSISFDMPKKLSAVVAFAGAPYPINLFPFFF